MQVDLTYEMNSKVQKDNCYNYTHENKYVKSWNSPKSKLKSNIAKIDEELLYIKGKIKNIQTCPKRSQSKFSFQYICNERPDYSSDIKFCQLLKEIHQKEGIIENMLNDMKVIEAKMNTCQYENMELTNQLDSEICLRMKMEKEIENLDQRINLLNGLEQENNKLKEDNYRMFKILEDFQQRNDFNREEITPIKTNSHIQCCDCHNKTDPYITNEEMIQNENYNHRNIHVINNDHYVYCPNDEEQNNSFLMQTKSVLTHTPKENDSYYYPESLDSDLNTNYHSQLNNKNRLNYEYGKDVQNNQSKNYPDNTSNINYFEGTGKNENNPYYHQRDNNETSYEEDDDATGNYQHNKRKSKSLDLNKELNKNKTIFEEEENSSSKRNEDKKDPRKQNKNNNRLIQIEDNEEEFRDDNNGSQKGSNNSDGKHRSNNIKNQTTKKQKHQTAIPKENNQSQTISESSIDDGQQIRNKKVTGRNQKSKSSSKGKDIKSSVNNTRDDLNAEFPQHLETNLETVSTEKQAQLSPSNESQVTLLIEKINQLNESLNISKNDLNSKQMQLETIEEENRYLKGQLKDEKSKEVSYKITESQMPLLQETNLQLSFNPQTSFFNQPIQKDNYLSIKTSSNKGNLFSKLNINTCTAIADLLVMHTVELSDNLIFKPYDNKRLLCFDITNYLFTLIEFIDYSDYDSNFRKGCVTYLNHPAGLYIITGENNDRFYSYTHYNNTLNKLSSLSNNHSYGGLVSYTKNTSNENCLICLSGWYNKKVEEFSTKKNEWTSLPEMTLERGESSFLVSNNQKLFAFFGYNCPQRKYLNTIDYCYINSTTEELFKWTSLKYTYQREAFSLYLKSHSLVSVNQNQFVIIGGFDGKENAPIDCFIQMNLNEKNNDATLSKVNRKLFNIDKHHLYNFCCDFSPLLNHKKVLYQVCFDEEERAHVINTEKMTHDVFYLN